MQLSVRLEMILEMAGTGTVIADIGTDHGFIPLELVRRGAYERALAMDVRKGPLARAEEHIRMAALEDRIETRLSDGMDKMELGEADTIVIAGMGGHLMADILTRGAACARAARKIILSPHYDVEFFHQFLLESGYKVEDECWIFDENKYYVVICCRTLRDGEDGETWDPAEQMYGRIPLEQCQGTALRHAKKDLTNLKMLAEKLSANEGEKSRAKLGEVKRQIEVVQDAIARMS